MIQPTSGGGDILNAKHSFKFLMIQLVETSFQQKLTEIEYDLLEVCRTTVCRSGIFEIELEKAELQFGEGQDND